MTLLGGGEGSGTQEGSGGAQGTQGTQGTQGQQGGTQGAQGGQASWRDALPEDIRNDSSLLPFSDVSSLAKSYVSTKAMVGKKGVLVPGEKATDEEWGQFFDSIGRPAPEKYEVQTPKDLQVNEDFMKRFKGEAHKHGLLPRQAQKLMDWYLSEETASNLSKAQAQKASQEEEVKALKTEWGQGYDKQVSMARMAIKELGGEDFVQYLEKSGQANSAPLAKFLANVGKLLGEDKLRGDGSGRMGQTPDEIRDQISKVMGDPKHAYFDATHPGHANALKQMERLYQSLNP